MATKESTVRYIEDQLFSLKVTSRKMFGEYALYCRDKVLGFVCDDTLFIKITVEGRKFAGKHYKEGEAYPGSKPYMQIDESLVEDIGWLSELADITADALPTPKKKKRR